MPDVEHVMILTPEGKPVGNELLEILKASKLNGETYVEEVVRKRLLEIINNDENHIGCIKNGKHYFKKNVNGNNILTVQKNDNKIHFYDIPNHNSNGGEIEMLDQTDFIDPDRFFESLAPRNNIEIYETESRQTEQIESDEVPGKYLVGLEGDRTPYKQENLTQAETRYDDLSIEIILADSDIEMEIPNQTHQTELSNKCDEIYETEELLELSSEALEAEIRGRELDTGENYDKIISASRTAQSRVTAGTGLEGMMVRPRKWYHRLGRAVKRVFSPVGRVINYVLDKLEWKEEHDEPVEYYIKTGDKEGAKVMLEERKVEIEAKYQHPNPQDIEDLIEKDKEIYALEKTRMAEQEHAREKGEKYLLNKNLQKSQEARRNKLKQEMRRAQWRKEALSHEVEFERRYSKELVELNKIRDECRKLEEELNYLREMNESYMGTTSEKDANGGKLTWWEILAGLPTTPKYL